tara:strand:+ start:759 stop:1145 length:387 start_codon:yes stop_codon:yes gene_type:complete
MKNTKSKIYKRISTYVILVPIFLMFFGLVKRGVFFEVAQSNTRISKTALNAFESNITEDGRSSASNHPKARAIGRLRKGSKVCTGWIASGGVLITAEHCDVDFPSGGLVGAIFEFNVKASPRYERPRS